MLKEETILQYLNDLASDAPTPGGGSAAGIIAATGISLALMSVNVSRKRKSYLSLPENERKTIEENIQRLTALREAALETANEDEKAFQSLREALRSRNEAALKIASVKCFEAPYNLTVLCLEAITVIDLLAPYVVSSIESDLKISYLLLQAALKASDINMKINLNDKSGAECALKYRNIVEATKKSLKR